MNAGPKRYVVGSLSGALVPLAANLLFLGVFVVLVGVVQDHWTFVVLGCLVGIAYTVPSVQAGRHRLVVGDAGVQLAFPDAGRAGGVTRRRSAWSVIHRLEVRASTETLVVVLRSDSPLPPWVRGRVVDPADPESGPRFERTVPGLDAGAFERAVRSCSPETAVVIQP